MGEAVTVAALGAGGDGVVETVGGRLFVPYTLPGETIAMEPDDGHGHAELIRVIAPSADRVTPPCRHFGDCGGCALQHMEHSAYLDWKRAIVTRSFALHGIAAPVEPVVATAAGTRRRAVFSAVNTAGGVVLGFHRRGSHEIVGLAECPVQSPVIESHLTTLREIAAIAIRSRQRGRIAVTLADNGLDIAVIGGGALKRRQFDQLSDFGREAAIARLTIDGEPVFINRPPEIAVDTGAALLPPPGGFVQASHAAEAALAEAILAEVGDQSPVADLFAGIGTFTLRLARRSPVTAVDSDAALLDALTAALRTTSRLKTVTTRRRDLFVNPLSPTELEPFAAVVFDPPAAGARAQAEAIAGSSVATVVAVSCNPATLARDARILVDGGYRLGRVLPVDQFLWSAEIEVLATFAR